MKSCPYCAEEIQDAAIICRFCGRELDPEKVADISTTSKVEKVETPPIALDPEPKVDRAFVDKMKSTSTEYLESILNTKYRDDWTEAQFRSIREILRERGVPVPEDETMSKAAAPKSPPKDESEGEQPNSTRPALIFFIGSLLVAIIVCGSIFGSCGKSLSSTPSTTSRSSGSSCPKSDLLGVVFKGGLYTTSDSDNGVKYEDISPGAVLENLKVCENGYVKVRISPYTGWINIKAVSELD